MDGVYVQDCLDGSKISVEEIAEGEVVEIGVVDQDGDGVASVRLSKECAQAFSKEVGVRAQA